MKKHSIVLLCLLVVTSLMVASAGAVLKYEVLEPLGIEREEHLIALPFVVMTDELLQHQIQRSAELMRNPPTEPTETVPPTTQPPETVPPTTLPVTEPVTVPPTEPVTEPPTEPPTEPQPVYTAVDESWFDDVLFIGDSRTVGLQTMARLGDADYFCAGSMTIFAIRDARLTDDDFRGLTLAEVLERKNYGKIYIHLGLNELCYGAEMIMEEYEEVIDMIRQAQPDAVIILQASLTITEAKGSGKNFPIAQLHLLNEMLKTRAESEPEHFRFCDTNTWAADEQGYLRSEMTFDGCHLYGVYYQEWSQWILEDAGWYDIP